MRILVVINLRSGGSDAGLYDFARILGMQGCEIVVRFASEERRLEDLVTDAAQFDRVVAAGGDGTVSAICYAVRESGVPVLVYPAGTANLLALNLGLPLDAAALARVTLEGVPARFDLGELELRGTDGEMTRTGFTVMAGAGYDAAIMESAIPLKSTFGPAAYLMAAVGNIAPVAAAFELVLDGEHVSTDGIAVLLVNFGRIQFDLAVTHGWDARDGLFDVVVIRTKNVAGLLPVVFSAMMTRAGDMTPSPPGLDIYRAARVEVSAYPQLKMQYDGESVETLTPFAASVLPGAATLVVPAGSPYALED